MAEKGIYGTGCKNIRAIGMIVKPFVVYYVINFITAVLLTYLVDVWVRSVGGTWDIEYQPTVSAVIGGLAMVSGILPLWSAFRQEVCNNNNRNNSMCDNIRYKIPNNDIYNNMRNNNMRDNDNNNKVQRNESAANHNRKPTDIFKNIHFKYILKSLLTITLAFSSSVSLNILFISLHLTESSETYNQVAAHQYGVILPVGLVLYGIVSPLAEEIVFRGIIYNRMKNIWMNFQDKHRGPVIVPMLLSSLLFGIYHGNIVQMLYGFLMGMLIAYVYEKCGHFLYAFLFHAAANSTIYVMTGNIFLYERFMKPYIGLVLAGITVLVLYFLGRTFFSEKR